MELLDNILRLSHASAGGLVLLTGILAIFVNPRGNKFHKKVGIIYFYGMFWIFLSSTGINIIKFNFFLSMISVFSFYLCFSAYRVLKRKKPNQVTGLDWFGAIFTVLTGIVFVGFGVYIISTDQSAVLAFLSMFFGAFTIRTAWQDIVIFRKDNYDDKLWWYYHHAGNMMGSFIAAVTAFSVQNLPKLTPNFEYNWIYWILPTIIGVPILISTINKEKAKLNKGK